MKILVVNPNASEVVTDVIETSARKKITDPTTEIIMMKNPRGTRNIDCTLADYQSAWSVMQAIVHRVEEGDIDAVVIAGFGNLGIYAYRELLNIPVVNLSEVAMTIGSTLGHRFTVLTTMRNNIPLIEDLVGLYQLKGRCASVRGIDINVERAATHREETLEKLKSEILEIVENDGAEVVVLGSAGLSGYSEELEELVNLPVLDPVSVTVKWAEMMVNTGLKHSKKRKFVTPPQDLSEYF